MNNYLIIFFASLVFLLPIFNFNIYGYKISEVNHLNEFKNFGFIPIKSKILPQFDGAVQESKKQVKSQTVTLVENNDKLNNSTKSVAPAFGVKILSPVSGKHIPVGNLTIFGVSTDNEKSDCTVSVDWNDQKPFQEAKATGPYGSDDYSSWTFTYSPSYHTIQNGINDLTSKLECVENSKVSTKWHSINVTGVMTNNMKSDSNLIIHDPLGILPQLRTVSSSTSPNTLMASGNNTAIESSNLLASLEISKQLISPGINQNFTVKLSDSKTYQYVVGANVDVKIVHGSMLLNEYNGTSDMSGAYSHEWNITSDIPSGKYDVLVSASANGYQPASITGSYEVQRQLLVEASLLKRLVIPGDQQTIDVKVVDANTKETISGANVMTKVGGENEYNGTSDMSGAYSHEWNITSDIPSGKYDVLVSASANGYQPASITGSYEVQRQLLVEASLSKDIVTPGDQQTIDVKVVDADTKETISGANVLGKIGGKKFSGATGDSGIMSYTWDTSPTTGSNSYRVVLNVSSEGYSKDSKTISFEMDKPQNLLEPPISNYKEKSINIDYEDLNKNMGSKNELPECANLMSSISCDIEIDDKPSLNPNTDDKPILDIDNENIPKADDKDENNGHDFLASVTK